MLPDDDEALWVSSDNPQTRSLLHGKNVVFVPFVGPRDLKGVLQSVPLADRLHREHHFTRVISTGSAMAVGFLPYLAARGAAAHYIESSTRLTSPSLSGRILSAVPGIRLYTQYERLAHGRWHYGGWVYDGYTPIKRSESAPIRRVVVTVGMSKVFPFRSLLDVLAPILRPGGLLERAQGSPVSTLWQTGCTPTDGLDIDVRPWIPSAELDAAMSEADVVISHAGSGSAVSTLNAGRLPFLIPRDAARGEIGDEHQRLFAVELEEHGIAMQRQPRELTVDDLREAATYPRRDCSGTTAVQTPALIGGERPKWRRASSKTVDLSDDLPMPLARSGSRHAVRGSYRGRRVPAKSHHA